MTYWATRLASGENLFETFLSSAGAICQQLIDQGWITEGKFLAAGLSRGGFAAFHLLARFPYFSGVCAFAPVTSLLELPEFDGIPLAIEYGVEKFLPELTGKNIYISIGNRDTRVGTEASIRLALALVEENHAAGIRALPVELCLFPARGHRGHGTPPERFAAGARWMEKLLLT
jgi:pimeloyl-ACP methyl ester carboxylesterase